MDVQGWLLKDQKSALKALDWELQAIDVSLLPWVLEAKS